MAYGRRIRAALPPMKPVDRALDAWDWLDEISAAST
jgi:hypothetical protein